MEKPVSDLQFSVFAIMRLIYKKLASQIRSKGRLLTDSEIFNYYAENVQRSECKFVPFFHRGEGKNDSYTQKEIEAKARQFYHRALGTIVASGEFKISI